jgi:hypothetical protein
MVEVETHIQVRVTHVLHTRRCQAAAAALRERVTLCSFSDFCVYVVTHPGSSTELWRFDTSIRGWTRVHNGAGPGTRRFHVMTSVGLDLWLHGGETGSGEGDLCSTHTSPLLLLSRDRDCASLYLVTCDSCGLMQCS